MTSSGMHGVVQADRDAAASTYNPSFHPGIRRETELGDRDHMPLVQAFARHRQQATAELLDIAAAAEDIIDDLLPEDGEQDDAGDTELRALLSKIRAALSKALSGEGGE